MLKLVFGNLFSRGFIVPLRDAAFRDRYYVLRPSEQETSVYT